ncbi:Nodule Cysteine-Rich (NCR) secreted peptide [Medicago truncatula]|uniref:Nodule Cysteine-Rich (NCR) secreted peptide n=2 Tax=Medicago truncatula TaxID=3880 RepID=G7KA17_MEDTR|nr:Nodule Cysteine-Rich (NCR) secreted peptide [Medicago truncatula]
MAKTCKLVFALILFVSLYLVSMSAELGGPCRSDEECPQLSLRFFAIKCRENVCIYVDLDPYKPRAEKNQFLH